MTKSSEFNEVLPESNVELERSYQRKHKKIDEEVDSQVNGSSKDNKVAVKKLTQNKDVNFVENIMNNERTDKAPSGEKSVFIVGDSIIKHINGYEISGKLENCKVFVRSCNGATMRCLKDHVKPVLHENPDEIMFHIGTNDLPSRKRNKDIAEAFINLAMSVITQSRGVSISSVTVRKDKHQNKVQEINDQLRDLCKTNNINFVDHSKSIKAQHLNKLRLHLTRRGTGILLTTFVREISNIFHRQYLLHSPNTNEFTGYHKSTEYKSKVFGETSETNHLKHIRRCNLNKLIFANLNINSIRNKFESVVKDISSNVDLLILSETKIDDSFPKGQFLIKGFDDPFRIDRNVNGGGILFYVREDIPAKLLSVETLPTESFYVQINLPKKMVSFLFL